MDVFIWDREPSAILVLGKSPQTLLTEPGNAEQQLQRELPRQSRGCSSQPRASCLLLSAGMSLTQLQGSAGHSRPEGSPSPNLCTK